MVGYKAVTDNGAALGNMIRESTSTYVPWDPKVLVGIQPVRGRLRRKLTKRLGVSPCPS